MVRSPGAPAPTVIIQGAYPRSKILFASTKRPSKALQRSVGAKADGAIGPQTLGMVEAKDPKEIVKDMHNQRQAFYERLKTFKTFGKGWTRRNKETLETALEMM
mgnify:CR=1 FL=1